MKPDIQGRNPASLCLKTDENRQEFAGKGKESGTRGTTDGIT
jgi:hypothetical protein